MLKNALLFIIVISSLFACNQKNAFNYSQDFVAKEKSLIPMIEATEDKVGKLIENSSYDSIAILSMVMEKRIDTIIEQIKTAAAPDATDGEKFKIDVLKYFEFMKSIYTTYTIYGKAVDDAGREAAMEQMQALVAKRQEVTTKIQTAQRNFAKLNGFKIQ